MSFFRKVRVLVGALVHKPFMPAREKAELETVEAPEGEETRRASSPGEDGEADLPDQERVADLIEQQQRDAG